MEAKGKMLLSLSREVMSVSRVNVSSKGALASALQKSNSVRGNEGRD